MPSGRASRSTLFPADIEFVEEGMQSVSLTFSIALYTDVIFSEIPKVVLECFEKYLELCPQDTLTFYATANMRRHKAVTNRTFGMLGTWLKRGAPQMENVLLEIKDGNECEDAPHFKIAISAGETGSVSHSAKHGNLIAMAFPAEWGIERTDEMFEFVRDLCSLFPFQSGHAGFSFEISRYRGRASHTHAWEKSMRHRGIDIARWPQDSHAVGQDALKGVGWLTIVCNDFMERLGGFEEVRASPPKDLDIVDVAGGVILKAGARPTIGDANQRNDMPVYRDVYRMVSPLVEIAALRAMSFNLRGDFVEKKRKWFRRLSDV